MFDPRRMISHARREGLELRRDPIRLTLALLGSVILMFVMGYGINLDVEDLTFAVLDRDQTTVSRDYTLNLTGYRDPAGLRARHRPGPAGRDRRLDRRRHANTG